jgi:hypothetical protein
MRFIHGELPRRRYDGKFKDLGPQYMRGLAEWADDGTFADKQAMWIVYSMNKEDIWVARVPLPVKPDETVFPSDNFKKIAPGAVITGWNIYSPVWAPVSVAADGDKRCLELRDGDPYDYARAVRVFPESAAVQVELRVKPGQADGRLEVELCDAVGRRPVRLALAEGGMVNAADGTNRVNVGKYKAGEGLTLVLTTDLAAGRYTVQVDGGEVKRFVCAEKDCSSVQRLSLRTGLWRGCGEKIEVEAGSDVPLATPAVFRVIDMSIRPLK